MLEELKNKVLKEENNISIKKINDNSPKDKSNEKQIPSEVCVMFKNKEEEKRFSEIASQNNSLDMVKDKNNEKIITSEVCVIFKDEEEEKRFFEITSMINHAKCDSNEKVNVYRKKL